MPLQMSGLALVDYFQRGSSWMWPLLACSLIALAVILYKSVNLFLSGRGASALASAVSALVTKGDPAGAARICASSRAAVSEVLSAILAATNVSRETRREAAQAAGARQVALLESGLPVLSTIASVAPLIGFLGTVSGMIRAFTAIAEKGLGEPATVAAGIGEALITTASGLIVAIPCFIAYSYFVARVNSIGLNMELSGTHLLNIIPEEAGEDAV